MQGLFEELRETYPDVRWHLCINQSFGPKVLKPTLKATEDMSDTSELLLRAHTLLDAIQT